MLNGKSDENQSEPSAGGDVLPLRALFEAEESGLLRFAFSLTGRRAVAEEIVQEVFLQLHATRSTVTDPRSWLYRSVRNRAFNHLRKTRRETVGTSDDTATEPDAKEEAPDELIARMEEVAELRELVNQLPEKDRRLIQLKYFEQLKYRDISQRTGLTVSNVGYRLHQVLRKLAAAMLSMEIED